MCNGDVLTDARPRRARRVPRRAAAPRPRSTSRRSTTRRRSAWCPPTTTVEVRRLRREAAAGRGADQLDQRRHLRARAVGARRASRPAARSRSSARRSRAWSPSPARSTRCASDAYWIDIGTPEKYLQAAARPHRAARSAAAGARRRASVTPGIWVQGTPSIDADGALEAPVLIGDGAVRRAGACVAGSVARRRAAVGRRRAASMRSVLHAGAARRRAAEAIDASSAPTRRRCRRDRGRSRSEAGPIARCADARRRARLPEEALSDAGAGHRRCRIHRLDARRPPARRGVRRRRRRRPLHRVARQPRRRPRSARRDGSRFHRIDIRVAAARRPHRPPPARGGVPPRRPGRRAGVGRAARVRRRGQRPRHRSTCSRARSRPARARSCSRIRRHDLRRARGAAGAREPPAAPALAVRRLEEGRRRLPLHSTARSTASSSPRSRWPTSTARARTPTARPASSRSSPAGSSAGEPLHDLRRRRARPATSCSSTTSSTRSSAPPTRAAGC